MGLLTDGSPLNWEETKKYVDNVRLQGVKQFINMYNRAKDRRNDPFKWGDEIEYMIVKFDHENKRAKLSLKAEKLLPFLQEKEKKNDSDLKALWRPEFGEYMVEGTPGRPFGAISSSLKIVEANMKARREEVEALLESDESLLLLTSFPRLGCPDFTSPPTYTDPKESALCSLFFPDAAFYNGLPRFRTLARNIRHRRGKKVIINVPIYRDVNTPNPFVETFLHLGDDGEAKRAAKPDHVYMDAIAFGMGCSCLQVTFQGSDISEAKVLYDQLTNIGPITLALTAASPVHRGYLTDKDCRWDIIAAAIDDRTDEELGLKPLKHNKYRIKKSRYDSIDSYLSPAGEKFNDIDLVYDENLYNIMRDAGVDHLLAQHIAHLFIRDPMCIFSETIVQDEEDTDHFENIQSTNWQSMRFKPPLPGTDMGWRVEFRPMEMQLTEFENAAYAVFIILLTRVILTFQLDFLIPMSKVDENLSKAQNRDAILNEKFWFRTDLTTCESPPMATACVAECCNSDENSQYELMTIDEIINGKENHFPGLVPLIQKFLTSIDIDVDTQNLVQQYLKLIQSRARGELKTHARWIREFIYKHPNYNKDSVVNERINYDLLCTLDRIAQGKEECPELLGKPI